MKKHHTSILVTILLLIVYKTASYINLTLFFSSENYFLSYAQSTSIFSLGLSSLILGFVLVELFFLCIPPLRKIRASGTRGRNLINKISLCLSFTIASVQAWGLARLVGHSNDYDGLPLIPDFNHIKMVGVTLFFVAGVSIIVVISNLLSRYGAGNGYCLLILFGAIESLGKNIYSYYLGITTDVYKINYIGFVILIGISVFIFKGLSHPLKFDVKVDGRPKKFFVTVFLFGAVIITGAGTLLRILRIFEHNTSNWPYAYTVLGLGLVFGGIGYLLFSHPKRISYNTFNKINIEGKSGIHSKLLINLSLVVFSAFLFEIPFPFQNYVLIPKIITLFSLIVVIAISLDLIEQFVFQRKNLEYVTVAEFDNVHFVSYLKTLLAEEGISHTFQGSHYRSLFFFLQPLVKMRLIVSKADYSRTEQLLEKEDIKIY